MNLLREYIRESLLVEAVEFREIDSPLKYSASNVKRLAYCDSAVTEPPEHQDAYFKEWEKMREGEKEIIPGVSDVCIIGFLDYHSIGKTHDGKGTVWYIDYMKTRTDSRGKGVASELLEQLYETVAQPGDDVNFGKMMEPQIGHLMKKMKEKYPEIYTTGKVWY